MLLSAIGNWNTMPTEKLFTESFATDEERNINWNRFLKQINFKQELPFPKVMDLLRDELLPMENKYWQEHDGVKL